MSVLKKEREKMNLTQEEAADQIGISISLLQKLEQGLRTGRDSTKIKVSNFYKKPVGYLFFNDEITKRDKELEKETV
ncbi:hypothetical protein CBF34_07190 [Vagococcus penaei]|uniref:helix-turn-helix domain-containing protein n=1 Tax=Vagococcus penaei TaxID=633807 RepID=UPI000F868737|nr:helix-turn-helix transcriptional regulator [Vagococcus penaei]RSU01435.1 hypothetical protein CBF34_07190 [Vagococcus penaei]